MLWTALYLAGATLPRANAEGRTTPGFAIELWDVPANCGSQARFTQAVANAVGAWPQGLPVVRVTVRVSREKRHFVLAMQTQANSGDGLRRLTGQSCEELLETASVVLSLALDAEALYVNERESAVVLSAQEEPAIDTRATEARLPPRQSLDDEDPEFRSRRDVGPEAIGNRTSSELLDASLQVQLATDIGTLPRPAAGLAIVLAAHSGPYRLGVQVTKWAEQLVTLSDEALRGGRFDLLTGSLQLCRDFIVGYRPTPRLPTTLGACLQAHVGRMSAEGQIYEPKKSARLLGGGGAGVYARVGLGLRLHFDANAHRNRPRYQVTETDEMTGERYPRDLHQPANVAIRLGLSWGLSF